MDSGCGCVDRSLKTLFNRLTAVAAVRAGIATEVLHLLAS